MNWLLLITVLAHDGTVQQVTPIAEYHTFEQCTSEGTALRTAMSSRVQTLHERKSTEAILPSFVWYDCIVAGADVAGDLAPEDIGRSSTTFATTWEAEASDDQKMEEYSLRKLTE